MKKELTFLFSLIAVFVHAQQINYTYTGNNGSGGLSEYGIVTQSNTGGQALLGAEGIGDVYANLNLGSNMSGIRRFWHISKRTSDQNHSLQFYFYDGSTFKYPSITFLPNGYTGIGTTAPLSKIQVNSSIERETFRIYKEGNTSNYLNIWQGTGGAALDPIGTGLLYLGYDQPTNVIVGNNGGKLGIGLTNPSELLHVYSIAQYPRIAVQSTNPNGAPGYDIRDASGTPRYTWHYDIGNGFMGFFQNGAGNRMVINNNGRVGIGTTTPDQLLTVNGIIHSKQVKIDLTVPGPDYVFEKDYNLPSLEQIKSYIDQNKHLPEVPSAKDMEANGVNVGEMNMLLLKKVEELTLYLIEQRSEIRDLKSEVIELKNKIGKK